MRLLFLEPCFLNEARGFFVVIAQISLFSFSSGKRFHLMNVCRFALPSVFGCSFFSSLRIVSS